jgi:signal transduction histidine kinase
MRELRHGLRTPINPFLGYCELIVEEAEDTAPPEFLAGMRLLHAIGTRMLQLTNTVFSVEPTPLHALDCATLQTEFRKPATEALAMSRALEAQARAAGLAAAAKDLQRIGVVTERWINRIEQMLVEDSE